MPPTCSVTDAGPLNQLACHTPDAPLRLCALVQGIIPEQCSDVEDSLEELDTTVHSAQTVSTATHAHATHLTTYLLSTHPPRN